MPRLIVEFPKFAADGQGAGAFLNAAYHLRTGMHDITRYDWQCYMDFAEGRGW